MKKRSLAVLMAGVMAASMMTGVVSVYADADSKTLTVGFDAQYPPFGYKDDNGEYVGFDLDLAQEVCDNLGWELVKKPINWDSKDMELNSGSIDCIWNGFTINGREDDYTWSDPYLNNEQVMVVAADSGIEKLDDLAGKNVVVQAASAALDALNSDDNKDLTASFASLTENPDYNTAFMNLDSGAADAIAVDIGVAKYQLNSRGEGFKILDETLNTEQYAIGFKKGNQELCDIVNKDLQELANEGKVAELAEKYEFCGREIRKAVINACVSVAMRNCAIVQQNDFIKACEKIKYEEERLANAEDHTQSGRAVSPSQKNIIQEAIKAKLNQEHSEGNGTDSFEPAEKETVPV